MYTLFFFSPKRSRGSCAKLLNRSPNLVGGDWVVPIKRQHTKAAEIREKCSLPGCNSPCFVDPHTQRVHNFCGRSHAVTAKLKGLLPRSSALDHFVERVFAGRQGERDGCSISLLMNAHPKNEKVKQQFMDAWRHPGPKPTVLRVYQVRNPASVYSAYIEYRDSRDAGVGSNELRRFHGTSLANGCNFCVNSGEPPCTRSECPVCSICCSRFELSFANTGPNSRTPTGFFFFLLCGFCQLSCLIHAHQFLFFCVYNMKYCRRLGFALRVWAVFQRHVLKVERLCSAQ